MAKGEVKWFNNTKGWGFVMLEGTGEDIFVHFSAINGTGYKTLVAGQTVTFELQKGDLIEIPLILSKCWVISLP